MRIRESLGLLEEMGLGSKAVLDSSVYTFNSAAQGGLVKKFGVSGRNTVPAELNFREMRGGRTGHQGTGRIWKASSYDLRSVPGKNNPGM